jgi:hypothetical protein
MSFDAKTYSQALRRETRQPVSSAWTTPAFRNASTSHRGVNGCGSWLLQRDHAGIMLPRDEPV